MKAVFRALIKLISIKSLLTGDKEAEMKLRFKADDDELLGDLNKLHRADSEVTVVMMDKVDD